MHDRSRVLARNLALLAEARKKRPVRTLTTDRLLQTLVADLVSGTGRRGDDARGCRRQDVDDAERRVTSGKRRSHAPDADHHREICGRGGLP